MQRLNHHRPIGLNGLLKARVDGRDRRAQGFKGRIHQRRGIRREPGLFQVSPLINQQAPQPHQIGQSLPLGVDLLGRGVAELGGEEGDHDSINHIRLGPLPLGFGEMAHACRIEDMDRQSCRTVSPAAISASRTGRS